MNARSHVSRGFTAGLVGAAVFAVWFLLVDLLEGQPFFTPAYMSGLVFSGTTALPATARVAVFTVLHFLAFGAVGVLVAKLLDAARFTPRVYIGIALGFLLFDIVFYGSVLGLGVDVVRELGWPQVLVGNILAGTAILAFMVARSGGRVFTIGDTLRARHTLRHGLIAGVLGATAVAVWFLAIDAFGSRVFYTPAALGSAVFFGADDPVDIVMSASVVLGYTLVHVAGFVLVGLFAAWLMEEAERHPPALLAMVLFFVTLEVFSLGMLAAVAAWLFAIVPWWSPIVANILAAAVMVSYLWRQHPALKGSMGRSVEDDPAMTNEKPIGASY